MAIPTVNQVAQTLMREVGEAVSNTDLVAQFEAWIQDVFDDIGIAADWSHLYDLDTISTVALTSNYIITGIREQEITAQFVVDHTPLVNNTRQELVERGFNLALTGKPLRWYVVRYDSTLEQIEIGLHPVPDAIYDIEFFGLLRPQELTTSTKLPFPRSFIHVLKEGVRVKIKQDDKNWTGAQLAEIKYQRGKDELKARNNRPIAHTFQAQISDIPSHRQDFVRFPPDHFRN